MINLFIEEINDTPTREALIRLVEQLKTIPFVNGNWDFIEKPLKIGDNSLNHNLGFKPKDVIILSQTGQSVLTPKYNLSTKTTITINSSLATSVRLLVGEYGA